MDRHLSLKWRPNIRNEVIRTDSLVVLSQLTTEDVFDSSRRERPSKRRIIMFRRNQQSRRSFLSALVLILGLLLPTSKSQAQSGGNPQAIPPTARPYGLTYGQWSAKWWQWALALPVDGHPFLGCPAPSDAASQTGPVWFLAGSTCNGLTVPAGKSLLFPLAQYRVLESGGWNRLLRGKRGRPARLRPGPSQLHR